MIDYTEQAEAVLQVIQRMMSRGKTSQAEMISFIRGALEHAGKRAKGGEEHGN